MRVTKTMKFDMAHRLLYHHGACHNLHGHTYKVSVTVEAEPDSRGMVADFANLKLLMKEVFVDEHDHAVALNISDAELVTALLGADLKVVIYDGEPTAENMAQRLFDAVASAIDGTTIKLVEVTVWETETSSATVRA